MTLAVPESLQPLFAAKVRRGDDAGPARGRRRGGGARGGARRGFSTTSTTRSWSGPGLRPGLATTELIRALLATPEDASRPRRSCSTPRRCDPWPRWTTWWRGVRRPAVLTPHAGEFARLRSASGRDPDADGDLVADDEARARAAGEAATEWGQVVVLKGARTVIAAPDGELAVAPFENPALASGGTGDVLSGTIGSLLAQGLGPFAAARLGVYLHGLAGEAVRAAHGRRGAARLGPARRARVCAPPAGRPGGTRQRPEGRLREPRGRGDTDSLSEVEPGSRSEPGDIDAALAAAGLAPLPRTAWLAIDLDRLATNLAAIRAVLPPGVRVEPVVKADAYGHGAVPVAHALAAAGADGLGVATRGRGVRAA